jgi:hypothetical protein
MDIIEDIDPGWLKKNGFTYEPFTGNASTRWGNAFENDIIWLAERAGGCKIGELGEMPLKTTLFGLLRGQGVARSASLRLNTHIQSICL